MSIPPRHTSDLQELVQLHVLVMGVFSQQCCRFSEGGEVSGAIMIIYDNLT
jgi:hypothetical protein